MTEPAKDWPDFTRATLLVGVDASGNPIGVLVDSDGNLNAILKGQGATGLQTIAVDENGRLEAFILDAQNQWGEVQRTGNAELASRLGSPTAWDWRGQVLVTTDFSSGWPSGLLGSSGTGASATISPESWLRGGFSVKLIGGSDGANYASVAISTGANPVARMGLAASFSCSGPPDFVQLGITYQKDDAGYRGRVRIDFDNDQVQVMDHLGAWNDVGEVKPYANAAYFHSFKFVVDIETGAYVRVLLDDVEIDISAYAPVTLGAGDEILASSFYLYSHDAANDYAYLDSLVLTSLEPENAS